MNDMQMQWQDGTEVFFILHNQQMIPAEKHTPDQFYIKGQISNGAFMPTSEVLGIGEMGTGNDGRYGWLELHSRQFFPMESDKRADTPFVKGYMTKQGFVPSLRDVLSEP